MPIRTMPQSQTAIVLRLPALTPYPLLLPLLWEGEEVVEGEANRIMTLREYPASPFPISRQPLWLLPGALMRALRLWWSTAKTKPVFAIPADRWTRFLNIKSQSRILNTEPNTISKFI